MSKFKVGDTVEVVRHTAHLYYSSAIGITGMIDKVFDERPHGWPYRVLRSDGMTELFKESDLELFNRVEIKEVVKNIITNMKEKFLGLFIGEPEKTYRKLNLLDSNGLATSDGVSIYVTYLMKKDTAFKTDVADSMMKEIEAEKK